MALDPTALYLRNVGDWKTSDALRVHLEGLMGLQIPEVRLFTSGPPWGLELEPSGSARRLSCWRACV